VATVSHIFQRSLSGSSSSTDSHWIHLEVVSTAFDIPGIA